MSTLSTEWAPGCMQLPGARPFVNMPADLEPYGVHFADEQLELLDQGSVFRPGYYDRLLALSVHMLADPVFLHSGALGLPALTLGEHLELDPVLIPTVVEIDCTEWQTFDEREPHWRRYPALLGRKHVWSPTTGTLLEGLEPIRLWNLWPINTWSDQALIEHAMQGWMKHEWGDYLKWLAMRDNTDTARCDYEGTPQHMHDHGVDEYGHVYECQATDRWFEHFAATRVDFDEDGDPYPKPFAPIGGLDCLTPIWETLLATSRTSTHNAISAYPEWEQRQVVDTERHYSPWLWSS